MEASGSYRNQGCGKQQTWISNLLNTEDHRVPSAVIMALLYSQHQKGKRKSEILAEELNVCRSWIEDSL